MLDRETMRPIGEWDHVLQSIGMILATPLRTRVMRREFGSELSDLIGRPMTPQIVLAVYAASALAIAQWEPRFTLTGVEMGQATAEGRLSMTIYGIWRGDRVSGEIVL